MAGKLLNVDDKEKHRLEPKPKTGQLWETLLAVNCQECGHVGELVVMLVVADAKEWRAVVAKEKKRAAKKRKFDSKLGDGHKNETIL